MGIEIKGYTSERDAAAAAFETGAMLLAQYLGKLDVPTSCKALGDWLDSIEARTLAALERESPGSSARYYAHKARLRVTVVEAQRDDKGRLVRTISRPATAAEAQRLCPG